MIYGCEERRRARENRMKSTERHHLKENDFAVRAARVADITREHGRSMAMGVGAVALVAVLITGFFMWRGRQADAAGALLGKAVSISQSQIAPPSNLPGAKQAPGTYPTDKARAEAALAAFDEVAANYPGSDAALAARYQAAAELLALKRHDEAATRFQQVISEAGSSIYGSMARLGLAEAQSASGKYDEAIAAYTTLAGNRDGEVPQDAVLVQLAETYVKAGKRSDARAAYRRIVDEFPESVYIEEARRQVAALN
jgi:TolA-binding protein